MVWLFTAGSPHALSQDFYICLLCNPTTEVREKNAQAGLQLGISAGAAVSISPWKRRRAVLRMFLFWLKMDKEAERISPGQPDLAMEAVNSLHVLLGVAACLDKLAPMVD